MKVLVLTEDSYGLEFINLTILRLKEESILNREISVRALKYNIYKLGSILRLSIQTYDKILVFIDCDGDCNSGNSFLVIKEIDKFHSPKVIQICFDSEIEDWLCVSLNLQNNSMKSSLAMKIRYNYEKYMLPKYVKKLDLNKLRTNCPSFKKFLDSLR